MSKWCFLGSVAGLLGAAGQLVLFDALRRGPAYLVFPVISLSPVVSVLLSVVLLGETASLRAWTGIVLALLAMPLLSYQPPDRSTPVEGRLWFVLAFLVFLAWGIQAYVLRFANATMKSESLFFYMMVTGLLLVPIAVWMTDFRKPINWGLGGPWLAAPIQLLNSIGALSMVYAFRYGRVNTVSPMINALARRARKRKARKTMPFHGRETATPKRRGAAGWPPPWSGSIRLNTMDRSCR